MKKNWQKKINMLEDSISKMKEKEENQIKKINVFESKFNNHILPKINKLDEYVEKSATEQVKFEQKTNNIETLVLKQTNSIHKEFEEQKELIKANNLILQEQEKLQLSLKQIHNLLFIPTKIIECENGLFKYLFDKYKANPINIGIVNIKGNSSCFKKHSLLPKLIDTAWTNNSWSSQKVENSYIKIDFINSFMKINKYHLCVGWTDGSYIFTSWILKGITENYQEIILDEVDNSTEITQNHPEIIKLIKYPEDVYVRSVHLIMKGKNSEKNFAMSMRNIEFYGSLIKLILT